MAFIFLINGESTIYRTLKVDNGIISKAGLFENSGGQYERIYN